MWECARRVDTTVRVHLITENYSEITENYSEITENYSEITENYSELTENYLEITGSCSEITEKYSQTTDNLSEITENNSEVKKNYPELTEDCSKITENDLEIKSYCEKIKVKYPEVTPTKIRKYTGITEDVPKNGQNFTSEKFCHSSDFKAKLYLSKEYINQRNSDQSVNKFVVKKTFTEDLKCDWRNCEFNSKTGRFSENWCQRNRLLLILFAVLLFVRASSCGVSLGAHLVCARVAGLTDKQRAMCRAAPSAIAAVGDGLRMAYAECRVQLGGHRWNCSGIGDGNHFGHVMPLATREAAFTYAITAAGVTHALSTACARGEIPSCGCNRRRVINPSDQFQWGGCGEAAYGARFARRFLDARELETDIRSLMNLHNNRVGRKMVKDLVRRECKCHGVSGSCAVKTCWRALPQFTAVAHALREKYHKAKMVTSHPPPSTHAPNTHLVIRRSRQSSSIGRQPRKNELVYLEASPSYCEPDPTTGSLGTHGRHCNRTSRGEDGCETLCCGRGYNTVRSTEESKCRCKFHWCCRVTCDTCLNVTEVHICK